MPPDHPCASMLTHTQTLELTEGKGQKSRLTYKLLHVHTAQSVGMRYKNRGGYYKIFFTGLNIDMHAEDMFMLVLIPVSPKGARGPDSSLSLPLQFH